MVQAHRFEAVFQRLRQLEFVFIGQQGAGDDAGARRTPTADHHALAGAHDVVRILVQNAPAIHRDLWRIAAFVHLGENHQAGRILARDVRADCVKQRLEAVPRFGVGLIPQ